MLIIGICGFQGSGKDTFSDFLVKNYQFKKITLAGATKDVLADIFGWDRKLLEGDTKVSREFRETIDQWWSEKLGIEGFTPRKALQMVGTDLFRKHFNSDIWIHIVEKKILNEITKNPDSKIIISDCRFPNEIKLIKNLGAKLIHIQRNKPEWFDRYKLGLDCEEVSKLHESEKSWIREEFDYVVENSSKQIEIFEEQIEKFIRENFNLEKSNIILRSIYLEEQFGLVKFSEEDKNKLF